ncbi:MULTISPECIES: C4-dicarboxylate TRAP transporter substrate-binding protein [Psychrilyobacter]|uniref:C4-dicarboxylate ABC transporter n=1 Tax=Psychrilyobacter piezotolerans TaxID=2293438 RepID=A0ABX9KD71_9FUSO|nr:MULTISPECIES: C4-dicarboxylate TRAP transporter substrate-binding protein [Psychrilyobacter]MCS5422650.1 C4-dicarboxylate TRAP transporter substrate-binding protein [Psychrilyobacter sp. S5]NDI79170.1 DctP family TRAP transporter solute-binding subunit [Psychrilyobacter piezotolerans]RDE58910.1 C4-dicarboxylate ABC transporter [Psychrilyobacter sp. S5]REI39457.1 C4-dicarboxylate ABC transporter [Psychrilyobacter piezotolerans]
MKKFAKILALIVASLMLFISCGKKEEAATDTGEKKVVIKLSTKFAEEEQTAKSLKRVVEKINERSGGSLELQLYPNGQLPIGKNSMEQVVSGANWISVDGLNFVGDYVPDFNAINGPMLYKNFDEYLAMTQSDLVKNLKDEAAKKGIKVLSLDYLFGFRSMLTDKAVKTPADLNGVKIRVPNSQLYMYTLEAMGANPTPLPFTEVYSGIQQGVVDGLEGSLMTIYGRKMYEVRKNVSLTNHLLGVSAVCISKDVWEGLSENQRTIIQEEFDAGAKYNNDVTVELQKEYRVQLEELGVKFNEVDLPAFNVETAKVFSKFPKWTPGIYDEIQKELKEIRAK